jgi:hypothetical protein
LILPFYFNFPNIPLSCFSFIYTSFFHLNDIS